MIGAVIKKLRKQNNMTIRELAEKIGIHYSAISRWESGTFEPRPGQRKKLAKIFEIHEMDFFK